MRLWLQQLVVLASVVAAAVPASAKTGRDPRSCYVFSDTNSPVASDAPQPDLVPIAGLSTPLVLDDDTPSAPIALPFVFEFFDKPYTSVSVSPNGFLRFGPPEAMTANWPRGMKMPDARSPNGVLAALWKDMDPSRGGTVVHAVVGSPPDRRFVVQFTNVPDRDRPAVLNSFQIELAETSSDIVVRYAGASGSGAFGGVEGENGAAGLTWFTDTDQPPLERAAVRYSPLHLDTDGDGWSDCVDTCRLVPNITQLDTNLDGTGDACERSSPTVTVGSGALRDDTDRNIDSARPGVALDDAGNAIVVWDGPVDGDDRGIAGRWFDAAGASLAGPFRVNAVLTQMQIAPRVATTPGGGFVVAWGRSDGVSKTSTVRLQRYDRDGVPLSGEQTLTTAVSTFSTTQPAVAVDSAGAATVAWGARYENPRVRPVELQRFDASGQTVGPIVRAGEISSGSAPALPDVVVGADGALTVAWRTDTGSVQLRSFDKNGVPFAAAPLVVALVDPTSPNRGPDLLAAGKSTFLTWIGLLSEGSQVFVQPFEAGVQPLPPPFVLETGTGAASNPAIAATAPDRQDSGPERLLVVWEQGNRILGQTITPDGRALERPFALSPSTDPTVVQAMPAIAGTPDGRAAVVWRETRVGTVDVLLRQLMRCGNGNIDPGEDCDDGNTVAGDCCSATCAFEPEKQSCDDGLFCTLDSTCSQGACGAGQPRDCSDGNACTADRCDEPTASCVFDPGLLAGAACDDGNACTQQDACGGGTCGGQPVACDDGNGCTADVCDPAVGCRTSDLDGAACDDGDGCTDSDTCGAGACAGTRVCGVVLPPPGGGGGTGGGTGGGGTGGGTDTLPTLSVTAKDVVTVQCQSQRPGDCRGTLFTLGGTAPDGSPMRGAAISKPRKARIGKRGVAKLKMKLNRGGRNALTAAGGRMVAVLAMAITDQTGGTRDMTALATLVRPTRR